MINNKTIYHFYNCLLGKPSIKIALKFKSRFTFMIMRKLNGIQLSTNELLLITDTIKKHKNPLFLIFGLGNDTEFWKTLNSSGKTVFLEDNDFWTARLASRVKSINVFQIKYTTKLSDWKQLLEKQEKLEISLPDSVQSQKFDVILVDAPAGYDDLTP